MKRLGQRFYQERLRRGLSIHDVSKGTKIHPSLIQAIEKSEYHKISSPSYAKGFVKNYAEFLGLPTKEILALFRREFDMEKNYRVLPETYTKRDDLTVKRTKIQFTVVIIAVILLFVGAFLFYQYRSSFFSPALSITTPNEEIVSSRDVVVSGKTEPSATVTVNNVPVALESDGTFEKTVTVFSGEQTIVIRATNRLGKETVVEKQIQVRD